MTTSFVLSIVGVLLVAMETDSLDVNVALMVPAVIEPPAIMESTVYNTLPGVVCAVKTIQDDALLPGVNLNFTWFDDQCESKQAAGKAVEAHIAGTHVFIGSPCTYATQSIGELGAYWNTPVLSWFAAGASLNDKTIYNTLIRTSGQLNYLGRMFLGVFDTYGWDQAGVIGVNDHPYGTMRAAVIEAFETSAFLKLNIELLMDSDASVQEIKAKLRVIRSACRIVILLMPLSRLRDYMLAAYDLDMTEGDFVFVTAADDSDEWLRLGNETWHRGDDRDSEAQRAFHSALIVTMKHSHTEQPGFDSWASSCLAQSAVEPWISTFPTPVSPNGYSAVLHDTIVLYARLLNKSLEADTSGSQIANGSQLFHLAEFIEFNGVSGQVMIDESGERPLDFSVWDMSMTGHFRTIVDVEWYIREQTGGQKDIRPNVSLNTDSRNDYIIWGDLSVGIENAPPAFPACGFEDELCADRTLAYIIGGVCGALVFLIILSIILVAIIYRKKQRQLIGKTWKIEYDEILFRQARGGASQIFESTPTLRSDALSNTYSTKGQVFTKVAFVRKSQVAVKVIHKDQLTVRTELSRMLSQLKELTNTSTYLNQFVAACVTPPNFCTLWGYCPKGSLQDVLFDENIRLDSHFKLSIITDVLKGIDFLHASFIGHHGRLKSSNVVIDSRWVCKLTDFGLTQLHEGEMSNPNKGEDSIYQALQWTAPEILRSTASKSGSKKGDMYSFGIIFKEVINRSTPYHEYDSVFNAKDIIEKVTHPKDGVFFRPTIEFPEEGELKQYLSIGPKCWAEDPNTRPTSRSMLKFIQKNFKGSTNIMDNMVRMLERYSDNLEAIVTERTTELAEEKKRTELLLYRMLPETVAKRLKNGESIEAERFDEVTIYFSDIVGFTSISSGSTPFQVVNLLNALYTLFDGVITRHRVYKVETIGDAYMIVSGLPDRIGNQHVKEISNCSLDLLEAVTTFQIPHLPTVPLRIRIGLHTGECSAGVVGLVMPRYSLFGDTVNTASRMESNGEEMRIHISATTHAALDTLGGYLFECRGEIPIKGKGTMTTYWLLGKEPTRPSPPQGGKLSPLLKVTTLPEIQTRITPVDDC